MKIFLKKEEAQRLIQTSVLELEDFDRVYGYFKSLPMSRFIHRTSTVVELHPSPYKLC